MITFKQFLSENIIDISVDDLKHMLKDQVDSQFIKSDIESLLVRGFRGNTTVLQTWQTPIDENGEYYLVKLRSTRKDRKPMDTHPEISTAADDEFEQQFGWRPRQAGLFCFANTSLGRLSAYSYGLVGQVFPVGPSKYLWSPDVSDFYEYLGDLHVKTDSGSRAGSPHRSRGKRSDMDFWKQAAKNLVSQYKDDSLDEWYDMSMDGDSHEIMINCDKYFTVTKMSK
jgi:hypothetical protein